MQAYYKLITGGVYSHFVNSHFVNSYFVNSHLVNFPLRLASFPGSPEREINTRGEPGIFSHVIKIGPEFLEQKGNILSVIQPALHSTLGVYDIGPR